MFKKSGFTLIELLIVIAIIGILATIGLTSYIGVQDKARDSRRISDLELIRSAIEQYRSNNNAYPATITVGASICDPAPNCASGMYLQSVPADPQVGLVYFYQSLNGGSDYNICAKVKNQTTSVSASCGTAVCTYCLGPYGKR